ncbi:glycerol-3-phosphate 1-O-acyltransferase PlsY [Weissella uvarum]|uniref:glycerol-3-phosphate 1-O-acyltransferase PlsY n=1 Tax=Weissella uvarum TaxID=1479233 RepID=UPI00196157AB|nr:glycerol-3-phosphate 1-O-acyltransferase PlsY [Weissella uvarum]MCM0595564.1 glycerol-3-phosphate 1-O-acyltransferase PlsY [Weissella uvarum]
MHFIVSFGLAYLIGSIPFGYVIGKVFYKKDLLKLGSGSIGTTNTIRNLGLPTGLLVFALDVLKGAVGAEMASIWGPVTSSQSWLYFTIGLGAILGHTYSIWIGFKGGKAVATSLGVLLVYSIPMVVVGLSFFGLGVLLTSMVSVGSMAGFIAVTIAALLTKDWPLFFVAFALTIFVIYRHRTNIQRIKNGTENTVHFGFPYWFGKKK